MADLILTNARIYTMDAARSWADSLAIADGEIVCVGTENECASWAGPETEHWDLEGKMVLPGFHDSHVHPVSGGIELTQCNLNEEETVPEVLEAIRNYAAEHPDEPWIVGGGWALPLFPEGNPSAKTLDAAVSDRPVYLTAADAHSAWVNSLALKMAGIDAATPDPPGGLIERDPDTGEPTGTLRESAMALVRRLLPPLKPEDYVQGLKRGLRRAHRFGITTLHEASASEPDVAAYRELDRKGQLNTRVVVAMTVDPAHGGEQIEALKRERAVDSGPLLQVSSAKIFVDGVIESHTAALLEPYVDRSHRGEVYFTSEKLNRMLTLLDAAGFQVHIHAIGDRAVRMSLDAIQEAQNRNGHSDSRHHIAHLQLIDPADIPRFRELGVMANFQPLWAYPDRYITELTEPVLGPERSRWLYPIGTVHRSGGTVVAGSDWSVSSINPLEAIQVAVTRQPLNGASPGPWLPEHLMDLDDMLAAYTINGAYGNRLEEITGSLETGKMADLVVLDRNLFEIPPRQIRRTRVLLTMLEGRVIYRHPRFPLPE